MEIKTIAVIGSRGFNNYDLMCQILDGVNIKLIVSGGAIGADKLAEKYAKEKNIETLIFLPDYNKYGKTAPLIRNKLIINECEEIYSFWDGGSSGTKHSINYANTLNKPVNIILYKTYEKSNISWNLKNN